MSLTRDERLQRSYFEALVVARTPIAWRRAERLFFKGRVQHLVEGARNAGVVGPLGKRALRTGGSSSLEAV